MAAGRRYGMGEGVGGGRGLGAAGLAGAAQAERAGQGSAAVGGGERRRLTLERAHTAATADGVRRAMVDRRQRCRDALRAGQVHRLHCYLWLRWRD